MALRSGTLLLIAMMFCTGCLLLSRDREVVTSETSKVCLIVDTDEVRSLIERQSSFDSKDKEEAKRFLEDAIRLDKEIERLRGNGELDATPAKELKDLWAHPERYIPERIAFLKLVGGADCALVPAHSYARVLERSQAICSGHPQENPRYIKVLVTTGPSKGQEGWGCLGGGLAYTVAWP
jgi:hypothetical protein